jgi:hypothetical protein
MYRFQASVHNAAVQALCLRHSGRAPYCELILGMHTNERASKAQNRDRIAVCVHTLAQCQVGDGEWLS